MAYLWYVQKSLNLCRYVFWVAGREAWSNLWAALVANWAAGSGKSTNGNKKENFK